MNPPIEFLDTIPKTEGVGSLLKGAIPKTAGVGSLREGLGVPKPLTLKP